MINKSKVIIIAGLLSISLLIITIFLLRYRLSKNYSENNQAFQPSVTASIITIIPRKTEAIRTNKQISPLLRTNPEHGSEGVSIGDEIIIDMVTEDWLLNDIEFSIIPPVQFSLSKEGRNLIVSFKNRLETGTVYTYQIKSNLFPDGSSPTYSFTTEGEKQGYQYDTAIINEWQKENEEIKNERIDVYISNILDTVPSDIIARSEYRSESNNGDGGFVIIVSSDKTPEETKNDFEEWLKNQGLTSEEIKNIPVEYYPIGQEPTPRPTSTPYILSNEYFVSISPSASPISITPKQLNTQSDRTLEMLLQFLDLFQSDINIQDDVSGYSLTPYPSSVYTPEPSISVTPYIIPSASENVRKVIGLAQTIISSCYAPDDTGKYERGRVRTSNHLCLNAVQDTRAQASLRVFLSSGLEYLQCVNFIHASHRILYGKPLENGRSSNNAIDFSYYVPYGYKFIYKTNPSIPLHPGTIAIWDYDTVGHIAYVTQVFNQQTLDFEVADANSKGQGVTAIQKKINKPNFKGWLVKIN